MKLYSGTTQQFVEDTLQNRISDKVASAFEEYYGRRPNPSEIAAWTNSLRFLKDAVEGAGLKENMIIVEFELPYSNKRIDCLIFGKSESEQDSVVLIELKQWSSSQHCEIEGNVKTFIAGAIRMAAHPSLQVKNYSCHLEDFISFFEEIPKPALTACVYLHNYSEGKNDPLFSEEYKQVIEEFPLFIKKDFNRFCDFLRSRLIKAEGMEVFNRFIGSNISPSKKLMEHTKHMVQGQGVFHLIDDQLEANNTIIDRAKKCTKISTKSVIIVSGGPGTGKSVIALNALSELLSRNIMVFHATGSSAFTRTLRKVVGTRVAKLFKFFDAFGEFSDNQIDVLICDEAHRIRKTSSGRYRKSTGVPQIDELIRAAKVSIFFIDEYQVVRPTEIGSLELIKKAGEGFDAEIFEFQLKTQFRCSGSDGYLGWIDNTLGVRETANLFLTKGDKLDFRIFDSPYSLYQEILRKNAEKSNSARLVAGFCWPWSNANSDGTLKDDVTIGNFKMPWEAKPDAKNLKPGIPLAPLWAYDPNGVNQIGSIYTIQGFEFEYVGVIFGPDLTYNPKVKDWVGNPEKSCDPTVKRGKEDFLKFVKNVYRVLLTRGMKGCFVYFVDKETENYVRSRMQI